LFFALSKTLGVMALPTNFLIGLGVLGALLCATRWAWLGRRLAITAIMLLAIAGFSPLGSLLLYPLESRFPPWNADRGAPDGIIVLGGPIDPDLSVEYDRPVVRSAPDRIIAGAVLARKYPDARFVFTGGSANLISNEAREADYAGAIFESLGIPRSRLIMERRSRNTYENAQFTADLVKPKPGERWLLVTSAYHMPRSIGLFRNAGFTVEAYPVDWRVGRGWSDALAFTTLANDGLGRTDIGMREWMGLVAYRLTGKIDTLLPGPDAR
jgi:uncharacterized SAM-binding protein YcdF (DUF218 family)